MKPRPVDEWDGFAQDNDVTELWAVTCYITPSPRCLFPHRQLHEGLAGASLPQWLGSSLKSLQGCWSESRLPLTARGEVMTSGSPRAWKWALLQQPALEERSFPGTAFSWLPGLPGNTGLDLRSSQYCPFHIGWEWPLWPAFRRMSQGRAW